MNAPFAELLLLAFLLCDLEPIFCLNARVKLVLPEVVYSVRHCFIYLLRVDARRSYVEKLLLYKYYYRYKSLNVV